MRQLVDFRHPFGSTLRQFYFCAVFPGGFQPLVNKLFGRRRRMIHVNVINQQGNALVAVIADLILVKIQTPVNLLSLSFFQSFDGLGHFQFFCLLRIAAAKSVERRLDNSHICRLVDGFIGISAFIFKNIGHKSGKHFIFCRVGTLKVLSQGYRRFFILPDFDVIFVRRRMFLFIKSFCFFGKIGGYFNIILGFVHYLRVV